MSNQRSKMLVDFELEGQCSTLNSPKQASLAMIQVNFTRQSKKNIFKEILGTSTLRKAPENIKSFP